MENGVLCTMKWAKPAFERFTKYLMEADRLLHLCMEGITGISRVVPLAEALADLDRFDKPGIDPDLLEESVEEQRMRARLAQAEIDKGFPLLHAHTVVGVWGALEATVIDFLVTWITNEPDALQEEAFAKIKIPLAEFECLDKDDRMRVLVNELERSLRSQFKAGVSRFEALLSVIGLSGPINEEVRKTLYEMFHVGGTEGNISIGCAKTGG